jgi:lactate permease
MVGRQLPFFSLIVPFWLIWTFAGRRGMLEIWPAILVCGVSFAIPQFLISNFINPWIVDRTTPTPPYCPVGLFGRP